MKTVAQRFNKFLKNIQLTESQIKDAITKHHGVRRVLHEHYYTSSYIQRSIQNRYDNLRAYEYRVIRTYEADEIELDEDYVYSSSLLVGSYGKNTAIRPPSDIGYFISNTV